MNGAIALLLGEEARARPYRDAIRSVGLEAVENPDTLSSLSGVLLTGGTDVDPTLYGQAAHVETNPPDPVRDRREFGILREAIAADLPVFAICRGLQLLNVVRHGTLIQHLDSVGRHRVRTPDASLDAHSISVVAGTRLEQILGSGTVQVNSRHHQAVDQLGKGLCVSAVAEDGVVEGIELAGAYFTIAVQWHPEDRSSRCLPDRLLFEAFAAAVSARRPEARATSFK